MARPTPYKPIGSYGVIGDLCTVALIATDGSVDFMCFPQFDSPTIFGALLDHAKGGSFQLAPLAKPVDSKQLYLPDSNILLTRFSSDEGMGEVSDFMPVPTRGCRSSLVRRAKTIRGELRYRIVCDPRFNYARARHTVEKKKNEILFHSKGPDKTSLRLRGEVPLRVQSGAAMAEFTLRAGECASFVLEDANAHGDSPSASVGFVSTAFKQTLNFWQQWARRSKYRGRWREMVARSALTLKLLTSACYGSLVAAPTFGLPEEIGGVRNWDYRYTWVRDASFTLYALMRLGYTDEAAAFMRWIEARCADQKPGAPLQIMYGIDGRHDLTESTLGHLEGYKKSGPVRIGNGAADQLQLDIYGELLDSVYIYNKHGALISYDFWMHLAKLVDWVCEHWHEPDAGVWEVRGGAQPFLYSRVMCWVAIDRGMRLAEQRSFPAPFEKWRKVRDQIYCEIYTDFWDPRLKSFVQYRGAKALDAATLLMPLVRFIGPTDPRWLSTMKVINARLAEDSLVYRYNILEGADTGFIGREGTFTASSFWHAECLARAGDLKLARLYFEKTLGYANHLGLYSEEIGLNGELLGNFPQAFTHLGLISAAYNLDQKLDHTL
jgi:GH15 family glucan-1,4-alpha-glucosidase